MTCPLWGLALAGPGMLARYCLREQHKTKRASFGGQARSLWGLACPREPPNPTVPTMG